MSCNYADGLSPYEHKGVLGTAERFDDAASIEEKCRTLSQWITEANHVVMHTGAGISTSAGIPDFRGPNGVWTLESRGEKPSVNISFNDAVPTQTHMAITELINRRYVKYVVSQNIDGLHLRSGLSRKHLAELHGNMFVDQCGTCDRQFVRQGATTSVGQKCLDIPCLGTRGSGRYCRGKLHDTILDWEANLPDSDLTMSDYHSNLADLCICLGTTLQIVPSGNLPLITKKYGGKVVIINLQPTKHDRKADLIINAYVDDVIKRITKLLGVEIPPYDKSNDPTKTQGDRPHIEWTIDKKTLGDLKNRYTERCKTKTKIKRKPQAKTLLKNGVKKCKTDVDLDTEQSKVEREESTENEQTICKDVKTENELDEKTALDLVKTETVGSVKLEYSN